MKNNMTPFAISSLIHFLVVGILLILIRRSENHGFEPVNVQLSEGLVKKENTEIKKIKIIGNKIVSTKESKAVAEPIISSNIDDQSTSNLETADESLLTSSVSLLKDVKVNYPPEARKNNIEGAVIIDIIVDTEGHVREANLIRGPGFGLNEAAMTAIKDFLFKPARIGSQAVAVKVRYSYRFVLENK